MIPLNRFIKGFRIIIKERLSLLGSDLIKLLEEVEQPLEPILAEMEARGICIDIPYLQELSNELKNALNKLETKAYEEAGIKFNLNSPKQLGEILFEELALDKKKSRKTKTGWSTDANVLEKLEHDHPLIPLLNTHLIQLL